VSWNRPAQGGSPLQPPADASGAGGGQAGPSGQRSPAVPPPAPIATDDAVLVAAARADRQAFRLLYERYVGPVYRFCYIRLGNREAAEDATSEVFLKALAGLRDYRDGAFAGWLFRIAHNVVIDAHRRGRRGSGGAPLEAAEAIPDPGQELDDGTIALRGALEALPDDQRLVLELQLAGWTSEQIASALDRSPSAIRMTRGRAIRRLRDELKLDLPVAPAEGGALPC
jgi:RNA polymerase sigma-70 factor (ECF subfamily)